MMVYDYVLKKFVRNIGESISVNVPELGVTEQQNFEVQVVDSAGIPNPAFASAGAFSAVVDNDFNHSDDPYCKTENTGIIYSQETGTFQIDLDGNQFVESIGETESIGAELEIQAWNVVDGVRLGSVRMPMNLKNLMDLGAEIPSPLPEGYPAWDAMLARFAGKADTEHTHTGVYDPAGTGSTEAAAAVSAHESAHDHTQLHAHTNATALASLTPTTAGKMLVVNAGATGYAEADVPTSGTGDMTKLVYDTDDDGKVDAAEHADTATSATSATSATTASAITGAAAAGNEKYYGTDETGSVGFHSLPTGSTPSAASVSYDNTSSGLTASTAQAAIDELAADIDALPSGGTAANYPDPANLSESDKGKPLIAHTTQSGIDASTALMLHCDGADGSTTFTDASASARTVTAVGNAQIDTTQSVFGGASALFDGSGDYLSVPDADCWPSGTSNWACEAWVRPSTLAASGVIVGQRYDAGDGNAFNNGWFLRMQISGYLLFEAKSGGTTIGSHTTTNNPLSVNAWNHVLAVRSGSSIYIFVNGVLCTTTDSPALGTAAMVNATHPLTVGNNMDAANGFTGHIDEVRISTGTARIDDTTDPLYIASETPGDGFTLPTTAYSNGAKEFIIATASEPMHTPGLVYGDVVALTDAASIATDAGLSNRFAVTLADNRTLANPTNMRAGTEYLWSITQDATGGRTLSYGTAFDWGATGAPTLSTTAGAVDMIIGYSTGTTIRASILKGFAS